MSAWSATQVQNARSRLKSEQRNDAVNFCRSSRPMPFCKQSRPKSLPELILFVPRFHVGFGILQPGSGTSPRFTRKEQKIMAFKQGEVYKCPDPNCGCEITVTKGAAPGCTGNQNPRCCCGKEMVKKQ